MRTHAGTHARTHAHTHTQVWIKKKITTQFFYFFYHYQKARKLVPPSILPECIHQYKNTHTHTHTHTHKELNFRCDAWKKKQGMEQIAWQAAD